MSEDTAHPSASDPEVSPSPGDGPPAEGEAAAPAGATGPEASPAAPSKPARHRPKDPAVLRAYRLKIPVEGHVEAVIKGGYEVKVGRCRGFCPHSQIDLHRVDDAESMVGKTLAFRVIQVRRGGDDVVVSRRALLEEERTEESKAVRAALVEGHVVSGRVVRLAEFGAVVDLGAGVTGLAHLTELSHARVHRAEDVLRVGDMVSVKILKLDEGSGKISLSVRQAQDDPWKDVESRFVAGGTYPGVVRRLVEFGAFVEIAPGLEALAPAREFPPAPGGWRQGLEPGTERRWRVMQVDAPRRRISVFPAIEGDDAGVAGTLEAGAKVRGRVQKVEPFGVFVWLSPGKVGLLPRAWSGVTGPLDDRRFPVGSEIEVDVVEIVENGRRIRLSVGGAHLREADPRPAPRPRPERPPRDESPKPPPSESGGSFGTNLGDMLRAALKK